MNNENMKEILEAEIPKFLKEFIEHIRNIAPDIADNDLMEVLLEHFSLDTLKKSGLSDLWDACRDEALKKQEQSIQETIEAYLARNYSWCKQSDGTYLYELCLDRGDHMSGDNLIRLENAEDPYSEFLELEYETYMEEIQSIEYDVCSELCSDIQDKDIGVSRNIRFHMQREINTEDLIRDCLNEVFFVEPPYEKIMNETVYVTLLMDTGDGNYDFTLNDLSNGKLNDKAGIVWLAQQQGYAKEALEEALAAEQTPSDPFLASMREEVANASSHMNAVTFLVKMTLKQYIDLLTGIQMQDRNGKHYDATENPDCGTIVLRKNTECGLFDPWSGAGSLLEVKLQKDVEIPIRLIWRAMPDAITQRGRRGYTVYDVYQPSTEIWRDTVVSGPSLPELS